MMSNENGTFNTVSGLKDSWKRMADERFEVYLSKESFKFNAAHFIAYKGFRERLHGHNYRVSVRVKGTRTGRDGYLMDFGEIKKAVTAMCKELNEHFICPMQSDALDIKEVNGSMHLTCEDGQLFVIPASDCAKLPLVHSSAEELAMYLWRILVEKITVQRLVERNITFLEVAVAEAAAQQASYSRSIGETELASLKEHMEELRRMAQGSASPQACFKTIDDED